MESERKGKGNERQSSFFPLTEKNYCGFVLSLILSLFLKPLFFFFFLVLFFITITRSNETGSQNLEIKRNESAPTV